MMNLLGEITPYMNEKDAYWFLTLRKCSQIDLKSVENTELISLKNVKNESHIFLRFSVIKIEYVCQKQPLRIKQTYKTINTWELVKFRENSVDLRLHSSAMSTPIHILSKLPQK